MKCTLCSLFVVLTSAVVLSACGGDSSTSNNSPNNPSNPTSPSPAPPCVSSISPTAVSFAAIGGTGSITVTAPSNCTWSASASTSWITGTATNSNGSGNALLPYTVVVNSTSSSRTGTIMIGGLTITITQSGSTFLEVKGNYTFGLNITSICGWPVRSFSWPVVVQVLSYLNGNTTGTLIFPPYPSVFTNTQPKWDIQQIGPFGTSIAINDGPGFNGNYSVGISGVATSDVPIRATDGRGEILTGDFKPGFFGLDLWNSQYQIINEWSCGNLAMVTWSMRIR